jgi:acyl transferase domain-containing protein
MGTVLPHAPDGNAARFGGTLADVSDFDAALFGISAAEAHLMDPQQRIILGVANTVLGHTSSVVERSVFVGLSQIEYTQLLRAAHTSLTAYSATGAHLSVAAGRISFVYGFKGPSLAVDTACSSSLVTLHLARESILQAEAPRSLSGGVNLTLAISWTLSCARAGMLADDGRCKTLDAAADGYVRSEGAGMVDLAQLAACPPGCRVVALLRGSAVNQDGRSSSLTAPNGPAQQHVILTALACQSACSAGDVQTLQMHGTGTPLGTFGFGSGAEGKGRWLLLAGISSFVRGKVK